MSNYGRIGKTMKNEAGRHFFNNLTPEQQQILNTSFQLMDNNGINSQAATKYAMEQATQGKVVSSDWLRNQAELAHTRGQSGRDMWSQIRADRAELANRRDRFEVPFLTRSGVRNAMNELRPLGRTAGVLGSAVGLGTGLGIGAAELYSRGKTFKPEDYAEKYLQSSVERTPDKDMYDRLMAEGLDEELASYYSAYKPMDQYALQRDERMEFIPKAQSEPLKVYQMDREEPKRESEPFKVYQMR